MQDPEAEKPLADLVKEIMSAVTAEDTMPSTIPVLSVAAGDQAGAEAP
ncbi:hypothetical protein JIN85_06500 [Luteolibacter pohnpeiensis]|uniref:Uncharacterized protein n=1 Tax=Luteolibacter pohnpeiensis TaxID=454153 RepID=A0A934S9C8_9BACT|nr:hypothetical protein [Luteolibacter pohnpeiensis]